MTPLMAESIARARASSSSAGTAAGVAARRRRNTEAEPTQSTREGHGAAAGGPAHDSAALLDTTSLLDTQETMDSATVGEILGSVDHSHVLETQVLLSSFQWNLDELMATEGMVARNI
ncbi:hypothetical protein HYH03_014234 [Edaphochlamys debaryana]|uniref:Uncharacterized protein n=1 Tax=Edaphochlamys debaryana TaxID=47281 RepID=A0A836BS53_9CHLO|nr:hypothetical protein HYH03_014234 [Edaphochlamys debaryana]|eukprot:KAG2487121.1 hypothetical protein HYH03_014234 [Edaphochlamys debaryana]